jgi:NADH dehydrogenase FAD-containing subunit
LPLALSPADVAWPIRHILRQQKNATVLMTEVKGIDPVARIVSTEAGPFSFDFLVIAAGARNSYFGRDRWAEVAPGLKRIEDATRIRRNILSAFEDAEIAREDSEGKRFWSTVHIYFLIGLRNRFVVAITWLWSYVTFKRRAALLTEVPPIVHDQRCAVISRLQSNLLPCFADVTFSKRPLVVQ